MAKGESVWGIGGVGDLVKGQGLGSVWGIEGVRDLAKGDSARGVRGVGDLAEGKVLKALRTWGRGKCWGH